jgi:deazaflavin-dependent oxidoreductase (nitroreductase family)
VDRRHRIIRRFNRVMLNPLMLHVADRFHGTYPAVVHHVGRQTGRSYRTPVVAQPVDGGFVIPLPYGTDTDWCRNVCAAGRFTIERAGQTFEVGSPEVVAPGKVLPLVPERTRRAWQRFHIQHFLQVQARTQDTARVPSIKSPWEQPLPGLAEVILDVRTNEHRKGATVDQEEAKRRSERVTGVSNVAYDLMVVLTNKLEGVAAMEEYKLDADAANDAAVRTVFERIEQRDRQCIDELRGLLIDHLQRIQLH